MKPTGTVLFEKTHQSGTNKEGINTTLKKMYTQISDSKSHVFRIKLKK